MGGQDDRVRHGPGAVRDVDAGVAVVLVVVGGERAARWDVGNREGMGEPRDVLVPVLPESPAADAVPLERCVVLPALRALPCVLRDGKRRKVRGRSGIGQIEGEINGHEPVWRSLCRCHRSDTANPHQAPPAS